MVSGECSIHHSSFITHHLLLHSVRVWRLAELERLDADHVQAFLGPVEDFLGDLLLDGAAGLQLPEQLGVVAAIAFEDQQFFGLGVGDAAGARGGNEAMSLTKGGSTARYIWPWMRMVCRSECLLRKVPERIALKLTP